MDQTITLSPNENAPAWVQPITINISISIEPAQTTQRKNWREKFKDASAGLNSLKADIENAQTALRKPLFED